jgi:hypothetical protein
MYSQTLIQKNDSQQALPAAFQKDVKSSGAMSDESIWLKRTQQAVLDIVLRDLDEILAQGGCSRFSERTQKITVSLPQNKMEVIIDNAVYSTAEAAKILGCKISTIQQAVRTGKIKGKGRPFRILGSELRKLC